jgi:CTP:molybdopterin cytidylyltransferase MocA/predicted nucleotidyltransferase
MSTNAAAVVLAAGAATRYGGPKQVELLPAVLAALGRTRVDNVVVVEGAHSLAGLHDRIVRCDDWAVGPGASLRCGLAALGAEVTHALVVLADGPELDPRAVERLLDHAGEAPVLAASYDGSRSHPVLITRAVWGAIPDEGGRALAATLVDCSDLGAPGDVDVRPVASIRLPQADQDQLDRVVSLVRDVLGSAALGGYLFGSAALGGLRSESDLDVLALSARPTTAVEQERLVARLLAISGRTAPEGRWRRIELTIVVAAAVRPWRYPPSVDFQYGDWLRTEFESGNRTPWPTANPDLASLVTMVLLANAPAFGPPPSEFFDPVPHADLVKAIVGDIDALVGDIEDDTRNVILTLARIWSTVATGLIRSKEAAADWALERLPEEHRAVAARARAAYRGDEEERWDDLERQIRPYADYVVAEIERLST